MIKIHGASNFNEYVSYIKEHTTEEEGKVFGLCFDLWNKGIHKKEAVKIIEKKGRN